MSRRKGDRVLGRRAHGGVLVVPCQLNDTYRYWFLGLTLNLHRPFPVRPFSLFDFDDPLDRER